MVSEISARSFQNDADVTTLHCYTNVARFWPEGKKRCFEFYSEDERLTITDL
jgi:hypothetical protein